MRLFTLFLALCGTAFAGLVITVDPATSATYAVGSSFEPGEVAATTDPLGPFSGQAVEFRGWMNGGSTTSVGGGGCSGANPCLVFLYDLMFSAPTTINSITFSGDAFNSAQFFLLNSSDVVIDTLSVSSGNVGHSVTETLMTPGATGTLFHLELFDDSTFWTFVDGIDVNTAPEPSTFATVFTALGAFGFLRKKRAANFSANSRTGPRAMSRLRARTLAATLD